MKYQRRLSGVSLESIYVHKYLNVIPEIGAVLFYICHLIYDICYLRLCVSKMFKLTKTCFLLLLLYIS